MKSAILNTERWGNSLGVRLPPSVVRAANLQADQRVRVTVQDGRVIIAPQGVEPVTMDGRLALFDPALHGGEAMLAAPVGAEVCFA